MCFNNRQGHIEHGFSFPPIKRHLISPFTASISFMSCFFASVLKLVAEIGASRVMTNASAIKARVLFKMARSMPKRGNNGGRRSCHRFSEKGAHEKKKVRTRMDKDENSGMLNTQTRTHTQG